MVNKVKELHKLMLTLPASRRFWCGASDKYPCACMGCCNITLIKNGYTFDDWSKWYNTYKDTIDIGLKQAEQVDWLSLDDFINNHKEFLTNG